MSAIIVYYIAKEGNMPAIDIKCPFCDDTDYESYHIDFDKEWITVFSECLNCNGKYQINYRAVGIDPIEEGDEE